MKDDIQRLGGAPGRGADQHRERERAKRPFALEQRDRRREHPHADQQQERVAKRAEIEPLGREASEQRDDGRAE